MSYPGIELNNHGYYEVINKPSEDELKEYYAKKYFQENKGSYYDEYSEEELNYFLNKIEQKYYVVNSIFPESSNTRKFLDIGCGEGFALKFFLDKKWEVLGLDYSDFGCKEFNKDCLPYLIQGDVYDSIDDLIARRENFDVLLLDNVLEHVTDTSLMLKKCTSLLTKNGILVIEVPNDFSILQKHLLDTNKIDKPFWVVLPDHLSYFNLQGLNNLLSDSGFKNVISISDHPIDFNLLNQDTNYYRDKTKGKACHESRIELENIIHNISIPKAIDLYKAYAELGLGRQIISFSVLK
jgi:2-polyprenyl-3-methyl-5-hydroxy-6-metoxy-1,4-benzoquinol methylase